MAHPIAKRKEALKHFLVCRTIEATARITGISASTLLVWSRKDNWNQELERHLSRAADAPLEIKSTELKTLDDLNLSSEDQDVLIQIKTVEGVCLTCIRDDEETVSQSVKGLKPRSFVEAVGALEKCWKARREIFCKTSSGDSGDGKPMKINYVENMQLLYQKKEAEKKRLEEE